jgi:hypothetical protein
MALSSNLTCEMAHHNQHIEHTRAVTNKLLLPSQVTHSCSITDSSARSQRRKRGHKRCCCRHTLLLPSGQASNLGKGDKPRAAADTAEGDVTILNQMSIHMTLLPLSTADMCIW